MKLFITFYDHELKEFKIAPGVHLVYCYLWTSKCKIWIPHTKKSLKRYLEQSVTIISKVSLPKCRLWPSAIYAFHKLLKLAFMATMLN